MTSIFKCVNFSLKFIMHSHAIKVKKNMHDKELNLCIKTTAFSVNNKQDVIKPFLSHNWCLFLPTFLSSFISVPPHLTFQLLEHLCNSQVQYTCIYKFTLCIIKQLKKGSQLNLFLLQESLFFNSWSFKILSILKSKKCYEISSVYVGIRTQC